MAGLKGFLIIEIFAYIITAVRRTVYVLIGIAFMRAAVVHLIPAAVNYILISAVCIYCTWVETHIARAFAFIQTVRIISACIRRAYAYIVNACLSWKAAAVSAAVSYVFS